MELKQALEQIRDGYFSPENPSQFNDIYNSIVNYDTCENAFLIINYTLSKVLLQLISGLRRYLLCADYEAYIKAQDRVNELYLVILNFSVI